MNDMITIYLKYDMEEGICIEEEIRYIDTLVEKHGWKYSGFRNMYLPIVSETREETVDKVIKALTSDERLKKYSPSVQVGSLTNACPLKEIDLHHMTKPSDVKYHRYEKYYLENKKLAHEIIVDENKRIRDGYISYLLAEKYGCNINVIEVPKKSPIVKLVMGHHVEYDVEQKAYVKKTEKIYAWIYSLREAVVPGDVLLVSTSKGDAHMQVDKINNIAGKKWIGKYKKVKSNLSAMKEVTERAI